jgi:hypothetical protein
MACTWLAILATSASLASGQPAAISSVLDVASVRLHKATNVEEGGNGSWLQTSGGGVTMRNAKLV